MIILDTNVVSEPLKPNANPIVREWLDKQTAETLYLTATSLSELLLGLELLPSGRRKRTLAGELEQLLTRLFEGRILPFDAAAASCYPFVLSKARAKGHNVSVPDGQIAAIAQASRFKIATRDVTPFLAMGIQVINPWAAAFD